ncbi:MAG TPA: hypothetical protein VFV83_05835 [Chthoniobacteraceae bacterium]|nr:hypothetical protein [Chthoniobacteraceae bacterium]
MDPSQETLFDDLMIDPATGTAMPCANEVVALVRRAKADRAHRHTRRHIALSLAVGCALLAVTLTARKSRTGDSRQDPRIALERTGTIPSVAPHNPKLAVERLDDKGLFDLLDATPSALIEWPDGRKELLLVVAPAAPSPN